MTDRITARTVTPDNLTNRVLKALGRLLFGRADRRAATYGWEISSGPRGLSRTYHDPRYRQLVDCPACAGASADDPLGACAVCHGRGRILGSGPSGSESRP